MKVIGLKLQLLLGFPIRRLQFFQDPRFPGFSNTFWFMVHPIHWSIKNGDPGFPGKPRAMPPFFQVHPIGKLHHPLVEDSLSSPHEELPGLSASKWGTRRHQSAGDLDHRWVIKEGQHTGFHWISEVIWISKRSDHCHLMFLKLISEIWNQQRWIQR